MGLYFSLDIKNPFHKLKSDICQGYRKTKTFNLSKYRTLELEFDKIQPEKIVDFSVSLKLTGSDHAGPSMRLSLLGYCFGAEIPDCRHWNHRKNNWNMYWEDFENEFNQILSEKVPDAEYANWHLIWKFSAIEGLTPEESVDKWIKNGFMYFD